MSILYVCKYIRYKLMRVAEKIFETEKQLEYKAVSGEIKSTAPNYLREMYLDLKAEQEKLKEAYWQACEEFENYLYANLDDVSAQIIYMRYAECDPFKYIAIYFGETTDYIYRKHAEAMKILDKSCQVW